MGYTVAEKLAKRTKKTDACWLWMGSCNQKGYGLIKHDGVQRGAHRWAYMEEYGPIFDTSLCVLHDCDNPRCVRPDHLYLGTHKQNAADRERRGRGGQCKRRGAANVATKFTKSQVRAIYFSKQPRLQLARHYGVSENAIRLIQIGKNWGWYTSTLTQR